MPHAGPRLGSVFPWEGLFGIKKHVNNRAEPVSLLVPPGSPPARAGIELPRREEERAPHGALQRGLALLCANQPCSKSQTGCAHSLLSAQQPLGEESLIPHLKCSWQDDNEASIAFVVLCFYQAIKHFLWANGVNLRLVLWQNQGLSGGCSLTRSPSTWHTWAHP